MVLQYSDEPVISPGTVAALVIIVAIVAVLREATVTAGHRLLPACRA